MSSQGVTGLPEIGERVSLRERVAESLRAALVREHGLAPDRFHRELFEFR